MWKCLSTGNLHRRIIALACSISVFGTAAAAQETRLPGVIDRPVPDLPVSEPAAPPPLPPHSPPVKESADTLPLTTLEQVQFRGVTVLEQRELQALVRPFLRRPISGADLAQLKFEITQAYFRRGYVLVKVTTPPQDVGDGELEIAVHEARIGAIDVEAQKVLRPTLTTRFSGMTTLAGRVFHEREVEALVNDFNDLTGVGAALTLRRGQAPGTTDLLLRLTPADEDVQQFSLDNYGSELTGAWIAGLRVQHGNALRLGERFHLSLRASNDALWSATAGARLPVGWRNAVMELEYSFSENEIGDRLAALDASGRSSRARIGLNVKPLNTRFRVFGLGVGLEARRHDSFLADNLESRDRLRQFYVETSYLRRGRLGLIYAELRAGKGVSVFDASRAGDDDVSRAGGDPSAWRAQPLFYASLRLGERDTLNALLGVQFASHTLLSSDLFALGGYSSVRGFEPAEATGEAGVQYSLEYQRLFAASERTRWSGALFADGGRVWNRLDHATGENALYSAGLGIEARTKLWRSRPATLRADIAAPLGDYQSSTVDDYRAYLRVLQPF